MTENDIVKLAEQAGINQLVWMEHAQSICRFAALVGAYLIAEKCEKNEQKEPQ